MFKMMQYDLNLILSKVLELFKKTDLQSDFQSKAEYACMCSIPLLVGRDIKRGFGVGRNMCHSKLNLNQLYLNFELFNLNNWIKKLSLNYIILLWSLKFWHCSNCRSKA